MIGQTDNKHVRANPKVEAEYYRITRQMENTFSNSSTIDANLSLKICLLNIQSLRKHSTDIKHEVNLTNCDILALMETQLLPRHSDNAINEILQPYELHRQDHPSDKHSSLAICTKSNIQVL